MTENTPLTSRETEILALIAEGKTNKEIAADLFISVNTVKVHVSNVFQKIGVSSRTEATLYAIEQGLVSPAMPESQIANTNSETEIQTLSEKKNKLIFPFLGILGILLVTVIVLVINRNDSHTEPDSSLMVNFSAEGRWLDYEDLTTPRSNLTAVAYESDIYIIGGSLEEGVSGDVEVYSPLNNRWTTLESKPTPVTSVTAILVGERIYVPGGRNGDNKVTDKLEVFDPRRNTWEEKASLPFGLSDYGLSAFGGDLYVFGGWNGSSPSDITLKYDPSLDKWSEASALPEPLMSVEAIQSGNRIVLTGKTGSPDNLTKVMFYFPVRDIPGENPWQEGADLPSKGSVTCLFDLLGELYAVVNSEVGTDFLLFDNQTASWNSIGQNDSLVIRNSSCAVLGGELFLLGGTNADGTVSGQMLGYKMIYSISLPGIIN